MSESNLRKAAIQIFRAALKAADPAEAVRRHFTTPPTSFERIFVVGAGKATAPMAQAVEQILGKRIAGGLINVKHGHSLKLNRIEQNQSGHPVPDEAGVRGAQHIATIAREATARDLLICLISGGASALMPLPAPPITLAEKQATTNLLLACGATIHEINAVRKHISAIKGGQLAALASPARVLSLILSDVIGDNLDVIGSGPTSPDASTFHTARGVFDKYGIWNKAPRAVRLRLEAGSRGEIPETPKTLKNAENRIIGSNRLALDAAAVKAKQLGFKTLILSSSIEGETREVAGMHAAIAREIRQSGRPLKSPACVISGGETTVTLRGKGKGGRNQEFALAAAVGIAGLEKVLVFSAGTDGTDGPTDAAGAQADGKTLQRGPEALRRLANNDSYDFFEPLKDLILTGPTGTNVMDIHLILVG
ncbi:MAG TPA: glycerate kinase [Bryobacteraceae bacterium]|jgi:hydroxypyruvate reductase